MELRCNCLTVVNIQKPRPVAGAPRGGAGRFPFYWIKLFSPLDIEILISFYFLSIGRSKYRPAKYLARRNNPGVHVAGMRGYTLSRSCYMYFLRFAGAAGFQKNVQHRSNAIYFKHYIFFPFPNGQRWNATGYEECAPGSARFHLNIYSRVSARGERDPVYISLQKSYCSRTFCYQQRCIDSTTRYSIQR